MQGEVLPASFGDAALTFLNKYPRPRVIVGEKLDVQWCNHAAEKLFASQIGLEMRGGVLIATDRAAQPKLKSLLQKSRSEPTSICMAQTNHEGWLILRSVSVESSGKRLFCLSICRAGDGDVWRFDHLAETFDLTRAESRVLSDLLAGHDAEALSVKRGVSIETTRTHIKNIYAKVGVKSREGLFARLQGFRS